MTPGGSNREGGCLCGGVRFIAAGAPDLVAHCHCTSCRKATGAAFATFADYRRDHVDFSGGELAEYASSPGVKRLFCRACGSAIAYMGENRSGEIHLHAGAFDAPETLAGDGQTIDEENVEGRLHWVNLGAENKNGERV